MQIDIRSQIDRWGERRLRDRGLRGLGHGSNALVAPWNGWFGFEIGPIVVFEH